MKVIGVAGHARAGKDTIAGWLVKERGARSYSFAFPIKMALTNLLRIEWQTWFGPEKELPIPEIGKSPRELAQTLGTEWGRNLVHPDLWVIIAKMSLDPSAAELRDATYVIPDVRFENEAAFVREHGTLVHVYRDGADGKVGIIGHESESGVQFAPGDILISNNGTIEDLHHKLGALFPSKV